MLTACGAFEQPASPTPLEPESPAENKADLADAQSIPPIYVTVAGHMEDTPVYAQCDAYPEFREKLILFAETLSQTGAAFNPQIEYEFFLGPSRCASGAASESTTGRRPPKARVRLWIRHPCIRRAQ
jgi:hypothetical protein